MLSANRSFISITCSCCLGRTSSTMLKGSVESTCSLVSSCSSDWISRVTPLPAHCLPCCWAGLEKCHFSDCRISMWFLFLTLFIGILYFYWLLFPCMWVILSCFFAYPIIFIANQTFQITSCDSPGNGDSYPPRACCAAHAVVVHLLGDFSELIYYIMSAALLCTASEADSVEPQIETTVRHHFTPTKTAKIKKTDHKHRQRCEEIGTRTDCWWECKLVQPLCRTVRRSLKTLNKESPYDPAIRLQAFT